MFEGRVAGDDGQEDKVVVEVNKGKLIVCNEWVCEWEERTKGRRWKGRAFYNPLGQTLHVSAPAWLFRSLLWPSTLSIGSGIFILTENRDDTRSSQSCTPLLLLLNWEAELGSSSCGPCFPCIV